MKNLPLAGGDNVVVKKRAAKCPNFGGSNARLVGCTAEVVEVKPEYYHQVCVKFNNGLQEWFTKEQLKKVK